MAPLGGALQGQVAATGGAHAVVALTHATPVPGGGSRTELKVVQPVVMARLTAFGTRAALQVTLNLEAATMPDGELAPGAFGEGFVDRRHPHTLAHELLLVLSDPWPGSGPTGLHASLALGKGFVPFGTDDPMHRPTLRYPVNHHWSQVLERWVAALGLGAGPLTIEAALFNGDEPERPGQWPRLAGRFGDSWSLRSHVTVARGLELQASRATVFSPEHRPGGGSDHGKWSASARAHFPVGRGRLAALAEWARTSELDGRFVYSSVLVEAEWLRGRHRPYARVERTERPEEQRTADLFRSQRPHLEDQILGITRWSVVTVGYARTWRAAPGFEIAPLLELSWLRVSPVVLGVFDPELFYGRNQLWSASVAVRMGAGTTQRFMGRYGVRGPDRDSAPHPHL